MDIFMRIFTKRILPKLVKHMTKELETALVTNPEEVRVWVIGQLSGMKTKGAFLDMLIQAIMKILENEKIWEMIIELILNMLQNREVGSNPDYIEARLNAIKAAAESDVGIDPVVITMIIMAIIEFIKAWMDGRDDEDEDEDEDEEPTPVPDPVV